MTKDHYASLIAHVEANAKRHPWYGPCDGMGEGGSCCECDRLAARWDMTEDQQREAFEAWISGPPFERSTRRNTMDESKTCWPGAYCDYPVELAWEAWQATMEWRESRREK